MAINNYKCNNQMLLHFEGLIQFNANSLAANHTIAVAPAVEMATYDRRTRR